MGLNGNHWYGARTGVDLCGPNAIVDGHPNGGDGAYYSWVPFGTSNWEQREWDFVIPNTYIREMYLEILFSQHKWLLLYCGCRCNLQLTEDLVGLLMLNCILILR
jgi:hypothetical protein